ncbi:hypothetical protein LZ554_008879 [Drepanopeziza brunnea f. sp. 'monogermtubi']|nr:hypothetical protein LZ554_008879 [Drepanopeziza brunnea f. sp. 'monogermtubi']
MTLPTWGPPICRDYSLDNSEVVRRCADPSRQIIGGIPYGNLVVKISDKFAVKFGFGVCIDEAHNQQLASALLDGSIVRVPRVVHFFTQIDNCTCIGYLVMEYIHGDILTSLEDHQIDQIAKILSHFSTIHYEQPGPLQGGASRGLLWQDTGEPRFDTVEQMESWLNHRLPDIKSKLILKNYPLVLCHLDLALRNIIWLQDGSVCLLDWCSAGFYPRFFEACLLKINEFSHMDYETKLIDRLELMDDEKAQLSLLMHSFYNGIRYSFPKCLDNPVSSAQTSNLSPSLQSASTQPPRPSEPTIDSQLLSQGFESSLKKFLRKRTRLRPRMPSAKKPMHIAT